MRKAESAAALEARNLDHTGLKVKSMQDQLSNFQEIKYEMEDL